ncbi:Protocadherin-18 [Mactra antiquata]
MAPERKLRKLQSTVMRACVFGAILCVSCLGQEVLKYSIQEQSPKDSIVGNIREDSELRSMASADDFSQIEFSILSQGNTYESYFTVDSNNGSLYTDTVIDREHLTECIYEIICELTLNIVAKSQISAFFRTLKISVTIEDINDNSPAFPKDSTQLDISELATVNSLMAVVGAEDPDVGNFSLQKYFILNEENLDLPFTSTYEKFVDGSSVVKLKITGDLDRETQDSYSIVIVAEDGGEPKLTGTLTVNINIDDTNDNPPVFEHTLYNITINETIEVGAEIIQLKATDADVGINSEIVYKLSKNQIGKVQELFSINESSGALYVNKKFESGGEYRIIVEATDKGTQPLFSQTVVVVTVLDSDNNRPEIKVNLFSDTGIATISEYADIGTVVAHIRLIDTDTGANGVITCDISSDNNVFRLQGLDVNEYKVTVDKTLDRETMDFIFVVVNCYDMGSPPKTTFVEFSVQVTDENDHSPMFLQAIYFVDFPENNDVNVDLTQVTAIDKDIGNNGEISYSLWANGNYRFSMDPLTGQIKTLSTFDRETDETITIYAYAKDNGSPARTSTATVMINVLDLNDNNPKFDKPMYEFFVSENLPENEFVGMVNATDLDIGANARLTLVIGSELPFHIDTDGNIRTTEVLDRENIPTHSFLVIAYDHGQPSRNSSTNIVVHVTDVNDHVPRFIFPDSENYTVELDAHSMPNSIVTKIRAFDLDDGVNGELFYSIQSVNVSDLFTIDGNSGVISLSRQLLNTDQQIYNILLRVDDKGNPRNYATTSLNIFISRKEVLPPKSESKGENLLIAIFLSTITFVLVFTIVLVICILKRRWFSGGNDSKDDTDDGNRFDKLETSKGKRVQFAEAENDTNEKRTSVTKAPVLESMTTFSSDGNDSRDSDITTSTVDMEIPILDSQRMNRESNPSRNFTKLLQSEPNPGPSDSRVSTPRSDTGQSRSDSKMMLTLQSHSSLLNATIKPNTSTISYHVGDDNHSQTSGETVTSDSGRGGSESDIHSAILSNSHDSDVRLPSDLRYHQRFPVNSTFNDNHKPWLNLADLRHHKCPKMSVAQQLQNDRKHRLQLKDFTDRNSVRCKQNEPILHRGPHTQSDINFDRNRIYPKTHTLPPPPSDVEHSFMTYEEDDDDLSTTTSGSYTIDHEDVSLDLRSPVLNTPALRGCLV